MRVAGPRAIALEPAVLLLEHISASVDGKKSQLGAALRAVAAGRGAALIAVSADEPFARAVAAKVLTLDPATGRLKEPRRRWFWPWSRLECQRKGDCL